MRQCFLGPCTDLLVPSIWVAVGPFSSSLSFMSVRTFQGLKFSSLVGAVVG